MQLSTTLRNNRINQIESTVGTGAVLEIRTGDKPANCAAVDTGTLLIAITLPNDWLTDASDGQKTLQGAWTGTAVAGGTAGHFRIKDSGGTVHIQGTVVLNGNTGDMTLDNTNIANGQLAAISTFSVTDGNA